MKKVALYVRTSTDMQANGVDSQTRALENFCLTKNILDFRYYIDSGVSGAKSSRPELDKMMNDCNSGLIESVIVYSFSRFARSTKHLLTALEQFQLKKINFISITENLDLSTPLGRTVFQIIGAIGELERDLIRERVRNGIKAAKARGKQIGAVKKYSNVEPFIQLSKSGLSVREIAKALQCSPATVSRTLKNQKPE